ncbi:MAG: hypothetical protein ACD_66C00030G0003, partial [uncultured bacterium]
TQMYVDRRERRTNAEIGQKRQAAK